MSFGGIRVPTFTDRDKGGPGPGGRAYVVDGGLRC